MKIHYKVQQRTDEWLQLRLGKITASRVSAIMKPRGLGAGARTLALELIAEKLIGEPLYKPVTYAMQEGIEREPFARDIFANFKAIEVKEIGGIEVYNMFASTDGIGSDKSIIEIKCPQPIQHLDNLLSKECPAIYRDQIQFSLLLSGYKHAWFISFNPDFPDDKAMKIIKVERDQAYIDEMEVRLIQFDNLMKGLAI